MQPLAVGDRFGRWTVIAAVQRRNGRNYVACRCDCGTTRSVLVQTLRRKDRANPSCGCWRRERTATIVAETRWKDSHGYAGRDKHPLYKTWVGIKYRCYDPKSNSYRWYGARGIGMHEPWLTDAGEFIDYIEAELGERPSRMSLDRIDGSRGYEPGNLRWATFAEQRRNRST